MQFNTDTVVVLGFVSHWRSGQHAGYNAELYKLWLTEHQQPLLPLLPLESALLKNTAPVLAILYTVENLSFLRWVVIHTMYKVSVDLFIFDDALRFLTQTSKKASICSCVKMSIIMCIR